MLSSETQLERPAARQTQRVRYATYAGIAFVAFFFLAQIAQAAGALQAQVAFPFAVNSWSDAPLLVQIDRLARGLPAFLAPQRADSFTYGPLYTLIVQQIDTLFESIPSVATLHAISATFGLLAAFPLALAVLGFTRTAGQPARLGTEAYVVAILAVLAYYTTLTRSLVFASLHPDALISLLTFGALACFAWFPGTRWPRSLLAVLGILLYVSSLTKVTGLITAACFFAALVVLRQVTLRTAALIGAAFAVAFAGYYLLAPRAVFEWTIVIPTLHYFTPYWGLAVFWREIGNGGAFELVLLLLVGGGIARLAALERYREAAADLLVLMGPLVAGTVALLKVGGGPYDLSPALYVAIALGAKYAYVLLQHVMYKTGRSALNAAIGLIVGLLFARWSFAQGAPPILPSPGVYQDLAATSQRLAALCVPGHTIVVDGFPDPLLRCPGATFPLWDSYLEIEWARPRGYGLQTVVNRPMSPDAVVMLEDSPLDFQLVGKYTVTELPYHRGITTFYTDEHVLVFQKQPAANP